MNNIFQVNKSIFPVATFMVIVVVTGTYFARLIFMIDGVYFPDLLLIPGIIVLIFSSRDIRNKLVKSVATLNIIFVIGAGLLVSFLYGLFNGIDAIVQFSHLRSGLYFIIVFLLAGVICESKSGYRACLVISIVIIILYLGFYFGYKDLVVTEEYSNKYRLPILLMVAVFLCFSRMRRNLIAFIVLALSGYLAILSNYRIYVFVLLFSVIPIWVFGTRSARGYFKVVISITISVLSVLWLISNEVVGSFFSDLVFGDDARYSQLVLKSEIFGRVLSGSISITGDASLHSRFEPMAYVFKNFLYFLAPIGLGGSGIGSNVYSDFPNFITIDSGVLFLMLHYGFLFSLVLIFLIVKNVVQAMFKLSLGDGLQYLLLILLIFIYLFVTMEIMLVPEIAICSGLGFALMFSSLTWRRA